MRLSVLLLIVCITAGCTATQPSSSDETALTEAVTAYHTAMDTGDGATVMQYIAEDAVMMEGGTIENRMQYEQAHLPADIAFAKGVAAKRTPIGRTVRGDVAWVRTQAEFVGTFEDRPVDILSLETLVLSREQPGWRIRAIHWSGLNRAPRK